jgi:capsular polysaccharide transport system permease protein
MIVCGITHERRAVGRLVHPLVYIMLPLSGAFYMMEYIPSPIRNVILYIPMAHCFELLRYGWFRSASPDFIDWGYLGSWLIGGTLIGLLLLSVVRKRIQLS